MKENKLNFKANSLKLFTPQKIRIINHKLNFNNKLVKNKREIREAKIGSRTNYSSFRPKEIYSSTNRILSKDSNHQNKIFNCLLINNRYDDFLNNDYIPSINPIKTEQKFYKTINSFSYSKIRTEPRCNKININIINTEELTKISSLLSSFQTPKKKKKRKYFSLKNFKFNSLLNYLNKKTKLKDYEIQNRYRPIIKEFFGQNDYLKFASKSEKFMRPEELKMLYKDTRLIKAIFDYLSNSFLKLRYQQAMVNQKIMNEYLEKMKKEKYYHKLEKEHNDLDKILNIKKIKYDKNSDKKIYINNKITKKEDKLVWSKLNEENKNMILKCKLIKKAI